MRCQRCGGRVVLVNTDKLRGVVGLQQGWVHRSKLRRHKPVVS